MAFATDGAQVAFTVLQVVGGHLGMLLILSTIFFSKQIVRHPLFVNFCITWIIYAFSYTFLLYTGQFMNPLPNFGLCLTQSAMIYGAPVMGGVSVFIFTLHLFLILKQSLNSIPPRWPRLRLICMMAAPYVAYIIMFTIAIFTGYSEAQKVHRSHFYCTIKLNRVTMLAGGISAAAIAAALVIETLTVITVHREWIRFKRQKTGVTISILIRTSIVLIFSIIVLMTSFAFLADLTSPLPNFVLASVPVAVFIVFGTQMDFMRVWFFLCMRKKNESSTQSTSDSGSVSTLTGSFSQKEYV